MVPNVAHDTEQRVWARVWVVNLFADTVPVIGFSSGSRGPQVIKVRPRFPEGNGPDRRVEGGSLLSDVVGGDLLALALGCPGMPWAPGCPMMPLGGWFPRFLFLEVWY